ncbi:MAG: hypothetical protein OXC95_09280, partial [Dehalococcoidia bacterium]|nr:hypothetical protein [Dehalococcoidia bacterium]
MKKRLTAAIGVIAAFWMVAGCGTDSNQDGDSVNDHIVDEQTGTMTSSGSSWAGPPLSPGERYELADIAVVGSPTTYRVIQYKPALDRVYPEEVRATYKDMVMDVRVQSFEVDQYVKGEGPDTIEVATIPGDRISTEWEGESGEDTKYFLYLVRPRDTDLWGSIYFADGYDGL